MISLKQLLSENITKEQQDVANSYFVEFTKTFKTKVNFKYIGLKNKELVFSAPLTDLGFLNLIISDAVLIARITDSYAYFGVIYTLNGLEQFDATVCKMKRAKNSIEVKLFDDSDSDFSNQNTNFAKLFKLMA